MSESDSKSLRSNWESETRTAGVYEARIAPTAESELVCEPWRDG